MNKLKSRWGIESNLQLVLIFIVFGITGSSSTYLAEPVLRYLGIDPAGFHGSWWGSWLYWTLRILFIFPIYQLLLLLFGWLFGQFRFFWNFEKKLLQRMGLGFIVNRNRDQNIQKN
jgi:hypothetical protein